VDDAGVSLTSQHGEEVGEQRGTQSLILLCNKQLDVISYNKYSHCQTSKSLSDISNFHLTDLQEASDQMDL